jgi:putative transcriptional regulator
MAITLKAALINKGMNQREVASLLGMNVDTISRYERGLAYPDVPTINKLMELYGVKYDDIVFYPNH